MYVNIDNANRRASPFVNVNGVWRKATPYVSVDGEWVKTDDKIEQVDVSTLTHFRVVYSPLKSMKYQNFNLPYNDSMDSVIEITGYAPLQIDTVPKSLLYRFKEDDKTTEGIYCLEGIVYGVFDDVSIPLSNLSILEDAPDIHLSFDISYTTESYGPYVMGWNTMFSRRMNIPLQFEPHEHFENEWPDPLSLVRLYKNKSDLFEEVDSMWKLPEMRINMEDGMLMVEDGEDQPIIDMKRNSLDIVGPNLIMNTELQTYEGMNKEGTYKNELLDKNKIILPAINRSDDYDLVALVGIAREMTSHLQNMVGSHGVFSQNWNAIRVDGKPYPFSLEYIKEVGE